MFEEFISASFIVAEADGTCEQKGIRQLVYNEWPNDSTNNIGSPLSSSSSSSSL